MRSRRYHVRCDGLDSCSIGCATFLLCINVRIFLSALVPIGKLSRRQVRRLFHRRSGDDGGDGAGAGRAGGGLRRRLVEAVSAQLVLHEDRPLTWARNELLRARARRQYAESEHLSQRTVLCLAGTNRVWPNTHCPYCDHQGVTSFELSSHRRAWYACLNCKKVWLVGRQA